MNCGMHGPAREFNGREYFEENYINIVLLSEDAGIHSVDQLDYIKTQLHAVLLGVWRSPLNQGEAPTGSLVAKNGRKHELTYSDTFFLAVPYFTRQRLS